MKEQTVQAFKNVHAILEEAGLSINDVVKTTVFLADMSDFAAMNEVYASQFEGTFPARSAVAVKTLPKNGLVEIEVIAGGARSGLIFDMAMGSEGRRIKRFEKELLQFCGEMGINIEVLREG